MDSILRAVFVYFLLLFVFRISGKRSLDQTTPFELVLILMLGGVAVPAMQGDDRSMTNAVVLIVTLIGTHLVLAYLRTRSQRLSKILSGTPILVVERGARHQERIRRLLLEDQDLMDAIRQRGIRRLEDVQYAIVERNGKLAILAKEGEDEEKAPSS